MYEMTLSSSHRIRNSSPGGLKVSTLPLGHGGSPQYWVSHVDGKKHLCFFQTAETGSRTPNLAWKAAVLTTTLGPPSFKVRQASQTVDQLWTSNGTKYCVCYTRCCFNVEPVLQMVDQYWDSVGSIYSVPSNITVIYNISCRTHV